MHTLAHVGSMFLVVAARCQLSSVVGTDDESRAAAPCCSVPLIDVDSFVQ